MKKKIFWKLFLILLILGIQQINAQTSFSLGEHNFIAQNGNYYELRVGDTLLVDTLRITIKFKEGMEITGREKLISESGFQKIYIHPNKKCTFRFPETMNFIQAYNILLASDEIGALYPGHLIQATYISDLTVPDDEHQVVPLYWELQKTSVAYWEDPWTGEPQPYAWSLSVGNPGVIVAVLDDGLVRTDLDFSPDNLLGYDYVSDDNDPSPPFGHVSHGTAIASIIAGRTSNQHGLCGIAGGFGADSPPATLIAQRVVTKNSMGDNEVVSSVVPGAIYGAIENGARIINMSWGGQGWYDENINEALGEASLKGIILLAAVGNGNTAIVSWPASHPEVIAVSGTDINDSRYQQVHEGSNTGNETEISFPGEAVETTLLPKFSTTAASSGTSISCAMASGVVALMLSVDPCLTPHEVRTILRESCEKVGGYNYDQDPTNPGHSTQLGYGRVNAYNAVLACIPLPEQSISTNTTWNTFMRIDGNVTIEDGGELTIGPDAIIKFHQYNKIIVKTGGRLIIDGGKITTSCDYFWDGIEVHGDPALPQVPSSNQGYVLVKNNGTIENAVCAIRLFMPDEHKANGLVNPFDTRAGGIAMCNNARFINNRMALDVRYLPNINNLSTFNKCLFEVNWDYLMNMDEEGYINPEFDQMVNLTSVAGIDFNACTFVVDGYEHLELKYTGKAIHSWNSNFNLRPACIQSPCEDEPEFTNTFRGFNYAIYAVNTASLQNFRVEQAIFNNNYNCIYANSIPYAKILKNKFSIRITEQLPELENRLASGLYLNECTGYHIEGNEFIGISENIFTENVGVYIKNSGPSTNYVYNNSFRRLDYGSIAEGYNCNDDGSIQGTGLCYKCNDFSEMHYDIFVANPKSIKETPYGIRAFQGFRSDSDTAAAGNVFAQNGTNRFNILNEGKYEIHYYYHELALGGVQPEWLIPIRREYVTPHRNTNTTYDKSSSCKSWIGKPIPPPEKLMADYSENSLIETASKVAIIQLKDGGNTETVVETIENSYPDEAFVLRDDLLSKSPYLSDVTLKTAIEKEDVLTNALLRDVLASNPQAGKSEAILIKLDEKTEPMPDEMYLEILESAENSSPYNMLLEDYAEANHNRSLAFNNLVETFIADTLVENGQLQLENLVDTDQSVQAELVLIKYYLDKGLFQNATSRVMQLQANLPEVTNIALTQGQLTGYLNIYIPAITDTLFVLDSTAKQLLEELSVLGEYPLDTWSENLLQILIKDYQPETYVLPTDFENKKIRVRPVASKITSDQKLYVYPNPASTHIVARYSIPEGTKNASLRITTMDGKLVQEFSLTGFDNERVIRINNLPDAVYITELIADGKRIASTKLTIVH